MPEIERHFSIDENILPTTSKKLQENECFLDHLQIGLSEDNQPQVGTSVENFSEPQENEDFLNIFTEYGSDLENSDDKIVYKEKKIKTSNNKVEKKTRCNECKNALNEMFIGCLKCQRFYLCDNCSISKRHQTHPLIFHKFEEKEDPYYIHMLLALQSYRKTCRYAKRTYASFICDKCNKPVNDERFYAIAFDDYDLCRDCFQKQDEHEWKEGKAFVKIVPDSNDREMVYEFSRLLECVKKKFLRNKGFINGVKISNIKTNELDSTKSRVEQLENELDILMKCIKIENNWVADLESRSNNLPEHRMPTKPPEPVKREEPKDEANTTRTLEELGLQASETYDSSYEEPEPSYEDQIREEILIIDNDRKRILFLENQLNLYKDKYGDL